MKYYNMQPYHYHSYRCHSKHNQKDDLKWLTITAGIVVFGLLIFVATK